MFHRLKNKKRVRFFLVSVLFLIGSTYFAFAADQTRNAACPIFGAEYVPQDQRSAGSFTVANDINRTLSFVLRIDKGDHSASSARNLFLYFDAYDKAGRKVSSMRLADARSNGTGRQSFSTYWGQFCDFNKGNACGDFKPYAEFHPIGVNEDFSPANIKDAPYLLIFPDTYGQLRSSSYQLPEHWSKYINFYTKEKIYPDFRGHDFWIRKKCGGSEK